MAQIVTAPDFDDRSDLPDWRYLLGRIHATFRAGSFQSAARFVVDIAEASDAADHHPDIDVRYPDRVHVTLMTHAQHDVTELDVELAATISALAADGEITSDPGALQAIEVAIDALDIQAVLPFWRAVLGYVDDVPPGSTDAADAVTDPARIGPAFWFQQMDEPRPQRNRIHIDVTVPHDQAEARIAAALAAGGTLVSDSAAKAFWVLADPEGNEACICTWQDRD